MSQKANKVLVCDDSLLIRMHLKEFLAGCGKELIILEAKNGEEAVAIFEQEHPQLVFLDVVMPVLNGIECLKKIRSIDNKAKVVMVSSVGTKETLRETLEAGAMDFVQKPFQEQVLNKILVNVFGEECAYV